MNLKVERAKRNITQEELNKMSGVSRVSISIIERKGIDNIQVNVLKRLAKALDVSVKAFFED